MAAQGGQSISFSGISSGSFAAAQWCLVKSTAVTSNGDPIIALSIGSSGSAAATIGVIQNDPTDGQAAEVVRFGPSKVVAGASISAGDPLATSTAGTAITANTTGQLIWGKATSGATAAGQVIEAFVHPRGIWAGSTA